MIAAWQDAHLSRAFATPARIALLVEIAGQEASAVFALGNLSYTRPSTSEVSMPPKPKELVSTRWS